MTQVVASRGYFVASSWRVTGHARQLHPLVGAVLGEDLDLGVLELLVLEHLGARLLAGVAEVRLQACRARRTAPAASPSPSMPRTSFDPSSCTSPTTRNTALNWTEVTGSLDTFLTGR